MVQLGRAGQFLAETPGLVTDATGGDQPAPFSAVITNLPTTGTEEPPRMTEIAGTQETAETEAGGAADRGLQHRSAFRPTGTLRTAPVGIQETAETEAGGAADRGLQHRPAFWLADMLRTAPVGIQETAETEAVGAADRGLQHRPAFWLTDMLKTVPAGAGTSRSLLLQHQTGTHRNQVAVQDLLTAGAQRLDRMQ